MKVIRAYGGTIRLWNLGSGWVWEVSGGVRYRPRRRFVVDGRPLYCGGKFLHAFGEARYLKIARRNAVNMLRRTR